MTEIRVKCRDLGNHIGSFFKIYHRGCYSLYKLLEASYEFGKLKIKYQEQDSDKVYSEVIPYPDQETVICLPAENVLAMEKNIVPSAVAVALVGLPAVQRALKVWQNISHFKIPDAKGDTWSRYEFSMMEFALALSEGKFDYERAFRVFQQLKDHKLIHADGTINRVVKDFL